ncbi:MAG TPA: hypothetical protein VFJ16_18955 [Longimicrobium sp.]|nr:hypothetical protein [Longimicrobium sp.]
MTPMVLCRKCAHVTHLTTLNCPRCGFVLPYWRSRRWGTRRRLEPPGATAGKRCPTCAGATTRERSPAWLKPLRFLLGPRCSYRVCHGCSWRGVAFHSATPSRPSRPSRRPHTPG